MRTSSSDCSTLWLKKFTFAENNNTEEEEEEEEEKEKPPMFYSQCFLSSKGPLGAIWVAGYCFKRLKKCQVTHTDISSSVDTILLEGLPYITYRILAYLLLGVVRIYSKKVEYLFQDCHEAVSAINRFSVGKKVVPFRAIVRSSYSITLPQRYELDAFQLEIADSADRDHISQKEDIIQDAGRGVIIQHSLDKHHFEGVPPQWEELHNAQASAGVIKQQETCSSIETPNKLVLDRETSVFIHSPPDEVLSPHQMEIHTEEHSPDDIRKFVTSKEKLRELRFGQEEAMDLDMICELDVELLKLINDYHVQNTDDVNEDATEKAPLESHEHLLLKDKEVPSPIEKTHGSEIAYAGAVTTPEFLVVPTPVKMENIRRPSKRKCIFDETCVLDNETIKRSINDASGLVCKRRKAPHTVIDIWRFHRIPSLSRNFLKPLIPCAAKELEYVRCGKKTEGIEISSSVAAEPVEITQASEKMQDLLSPRTPSESRSTIAPGTPVRCPTSARVFGSARAADSDGEGVRSYDIVRKDLPVHEEEDLSPSLMTEMDANEGDSQELCKNKNGLSARTRTVARYLHRVIHKKKQQGDDTVALLPILERKTRVENARFFFEILVLSSGGFINVMQERAFEDVILQETPKLEATLRIC